MPLYNVRLYCPFDYRNTFIVTEDAGSKEEAQNLVIGSRRTCPFDRRHVFTVEPYNIIGIYPAPTPSQVLPYKSGYIPEHPAPKWLLGAKVMEDKPLPVGAEPVESPYLKSITPDTLTTVIYEQKVRSKEYPALTFHIQFGRTIHTKFIQEAKRMAKTGKIPEALLYLILHAPGVTTRMAADILGIGYWTAYRAAANMAQPTIEQQEEYLAEIEESAELGKWSPEVKERTRQGVIEELKRTTKTPRLRFSHKWREQITLIPIRPLTEREMLNDLRRLVSLNAYMPTPAEWILMKQKLREQSDAYTRESIMHYIAQE